MYRLTEYHTGTRINVYRRVFLNGAYGWLPTKQTFIYWWEYRPSLSNNASNNALTA